MISLRLLLGRLRADPDHLRVGSDVLSNPIEQTYIGSHQVRLAVSINNLAMIMLPVSPTEVGRKLPKANSLELKYVRYKVEAGAQIDFIAIRCLAENLESVFLDMAENICSRIRNGNGALSSIDESIKEFKELLLGPLEVVSDARMKGLFGELIVLEKLLHKDGDSTKYWTGPGGHRRDFVFSGSCVEVKTSERSHEQIVHISSLDQLCTDSGDLLYLWYVEVEENPSGGVTITDLVNRINSLVSSVNEFRDALEKVGYKPASPDSWDRKSFDITVNQAYLVDDSFPRVVPSSFVAGKPDGISHVTYKVNLDQASSNRVEESGLVGKLL